MSKKVILIDDDGLVRSSLARLLENHGFHCVCYESAEKFLADLPTIQADIGCLLLDFRLSKGSGLSLLDELDSRDCDIPFLMISGYGQIPDATSAMRRGAIDFLEKPVNPRLLIDRIRQAMEYSNSESAARSDQRLFKMRLKSLTPRESQVLELVVDGKPSRWIAEHLGISVKTVEVHRGNLMRKMHVANSVELVRQVFENRSSDSTARRTDSSQTPTPNTLPEGIPHAPLNARERT